MNSPVHNDCTHKNRFSISVKGSDRFYFTWPNGAEGIGYAPSIQGLCGEDYLEMTICCDCSRVLEIPSLQGFSDAQEEWEEERR